jgi:hypothetical protein
MHQLFIQFINYVWQLLRVSALHCHTQGAFLLPSERCLNEGKPIHNILSTASRLSISQKALGSVPKEGNVMPKHVGDTVYIVVNKLND